MLKKLSLLVFLLLQLLFGVTAANAAPTLCTIAGGTNYAPAVTANLFPRDAPIGTQSPPYSTLVQISCVSDVTAYSMSVYTNAPTGVEVPGFTNYYQTNIPGIAVRYIAEMDQIPLAHLIREAGHRQY